MATSDVSLTEQIAEPASGARVVKAFNQAQATVWAMDPPVFDGRSLTVPICGDDPAAKAVVADLVAELGCCTLDAGPLTQARNLEAMAVVSIRLLFSGADPSTVFNLVDQRSRSKAATA